MRPEQTGAGSPRYGRGGDIPNIFTSASPVQAIASARESRRCRLGTAAVMPSIRGSGRTSESAAQAEAAAHLGQDAGRLPSGCDGALTLR